MCSAMDSVRFATPDPSNATPKMEVNLRFLVLADLAAGVTADGPPRVVDGHSLDELMADLKPQLRLSVPNHLGTGSREIDFTLSPQSLDDLNPDGLATGIAQIAPVVDARALVTKCLSGELPAEHLPDALRDVLGDSPLTAALDQALSGTPTAAAEPSSKESSASADPIAAILDKVQVPGSPSAGSGPGQAASLADTLAEAVVPVATSGADRQQLNGLVAELDRRISRQVDAVLAHDSFQQFERAWRSLQFLARRTLRTPGRIEVLASPSDEALDVFFDRVFHTEYEQQSDIPLTAVLFDRPFGRSPADISELQAAARLGESLGTPFIASMAADFWGMKQHRRIASLPDLNEKVLGTEYSKWRGFRSDPLSLWICITANRFLLRPAWSTRSDRVRRFNWTGVDGEPLWGEGSWALFTALLTSFAADGLKFLCIGPRSPGSLELPVATYATGKEDPVELPLEVRLTDQRAYDLRHLGFAPIMARANTDSAYFTAAPTVHAPARYDDDKATHASFRAATLPFQLFAGIVAHIVQRIGQDVPAGTSGEALHAAFRDPLLSLLATTEENPQPEEVEVESTPNEDDPGLLDVTVRVRPEFPLYGGEVDLIAGTSVPR